MIDIKKLVHQHTALISKLRRDLHRVPETACTEEKTSRYVAAYLKNLGLEVKTGIARYGVVGLLEGCASGKTLMIRADMDALEITEETGLDFASAHQGLMHACGHDAHMSMALVAATILSQMKDQLKGAIKFLFQPAEEGPGGAEAMIHEGVMENPHVDYAVGCHVWPGISEGTIGVKTGPLMAAMDRFDLKIMGKGGHGAMPHQCVDALEAGCQVVGALQRMVSRQMDPVTPAVVTVGSFHAGNAFNVIPGEAEMSGATRTFDRVVWQGLPQRMERIVRGVCDSMCASYELDYVHGYPPLINDADVSRMVRECAEAVVGKENVLKPEPTMGGEDMALFLERAKGCFFFLGVGREGSAPLHNAQFDFSEQPLSLGVETYCRIALALCSYGVSP
ncbi:MAG: peptidase M20 [Desulfobacteraceae bacterium 4572_87]|nr:MAG: peptidase M20 [Desulfobacteraceae bacterium 4572_87]